MDIYLSRFIDSWSWYMVRGAGFMAILLLILLMISGIGHVTGWTYKVIEPVKAWLVHKWLAYMLLICVAFHLVGLLIDHYVPFSLIDVLVPFVRTYTNGVPLFGIALGSFAVTAGILAVYGIAYVVLTSLYFMNSHKQFWRYSHIVSYFVMVFVFIHALSVGTDTKSGVIRVVMITLFILLVLAIVMRLRRQHRRP